MTSAAHLQIVLEARDQASKAIGDLNKNVGGLGKTLADVGKIAAGFLAANVVSGGVQKLTGFLGDSIDAAKESRAVNAQLEAVLKSTGGAAGLSAKEIQGMAGKLERLSVFEDEAILGGQNLLLTFTNIGRDVFPAATQTMVDMSQALGQDMTSSAVQLGKALNDPINGITALSRVGVSFTEQQKAQIRAMTEAGDVAGAQALILAELEKEFGGSAQAASDAAGASERYKDRMNDLKETIGEKLLPIQLAITEAKARMVEFIATKVIPTLEDLYTKHWPAVSAALESVRAFLVDTLVPAFSSGFGTIMTVVKPVVEFILNNQGTLIAAIAGIGAVIVTSLGPVSAAALALTGLIAVVGLVRENWGAFETFARGVWNNIAAGVADAVNAVIAHINSLIRAWNSLPFGDVGQIATIGTRATLEFENAQRLRELGQTELPDVPADWNFPVPPPSYAIGTPFVPRTGWAMLHRGEAVIPAAENRRGQASEGMGGPAIIINIDTVIATNRAEAERSAGDMAFGLAAALRARGVA